MDFGSSRTRRGTTGPTASPSAHPPHHRGRVASWSADEWAILKKEWHGPLLLREIVVKLIGRTTDAVQTSGYKRYGPRYPNKRWHDESLVESLKRLWAAGYSASLIAIKLGAGFTRNAIIGKLDRLGLLGGQTLNRQTQQRKSGGRSLRRRDAPGRVASAVSSPLTAAPVPPSFKLSIADWSDTKCKFIAGDDRLACGHPVHVASPYCPSHYLLCNQARGTA